MVLRGWEEEEESKRDGHGNRVEEGEKILDAVEGSPMFIEVKDDSQVCIWVYVRLCVCGYSLVLEWLFPSTVSKLWRIV